MTDPTATLYHDGSVELRMTIPKSAFMSSNQMPRRIGHHTRIKDELRWLARAAVLAQGRPALRGRVLLTWWIGYPPRTRTADPSNTQPMTKPILDQLVREGVLAGDSSDLVTETWKRDTPSGQAGVHTVRLTIQPNPKEITP